MHRRRRNWVATGPGDQARLVCASRKLIICLVVANAPHVYARRAPPFWSSANVKASATCRVWAITWSRMALRSFSVRVSGAQASTSSISCSTSDTIFSGEGFTELLFGGKAVWCIHGDIYERVPPVSSRRSSWPRRW